MAAATRGAMNVAPGDGGRDPVRMLAAGGVLVTFAVIVASAWLRLAHIGLGCEPWPACYGAPALASDSALIVALRAAHRLAATAVALLAVLALAYAWPRRTHRRARARACLALVVLTLLLAGLGLTAGRSLSPSVAIFNVAGGLAMLALFAALAAGGAAGTGWRNSMAFAVGGLLAIAVVLGVATSATLSGRICSGLLTCHLDPVLAARADAAARAGLNMAHRAAALAAAAVLIAGAVAAWRRSHQARIVASVLLVLLVLQVALGYALVRLDLPIGVAVAHAGVAALVVGVVVVGGCYCRLSDDDAVSALCHTRTSNQPRGSNAQR